MRVAIGLVVVIVVVLTLGTSARAQDPMTYDPTFYEQQDFLNPANPFSPIAVRLRKQKALQKQQTTLANLEKTTAVVALNVTTGVASGVTSGVTNVSKLYTQLTDPNNAIPSVSSGPGSPLQQQGSLSGTAAQAQSPTPPTPPLFPAQPSKFNLFPSIFGPSNPGGATPGITKMQ